jgi:hypothetical protein
MAPPGEAAWGHAADAENADRHAGRDYLRPVDVAAAVILPERMPRMPWPLEALYWCVAGLLWVVPVRWLMLWAAGKR